MFFLQQNTEFIALNQFTLSDALFFPQLAFAVRCGYPIEKYPRLSEDSFVSVHD
jgi:hypothetical protein